MTGQKTTSKKIKKGLKGPHVPTLSYSILRLVLKVPGFHYSFYILKNTRMFVNTEHFGFNTTVAYQ